MEAEVLRRTDELRTALINAVSHDLRTPLASIIASAGSLLQEDVQWTEEDRREFAQAIEDEAERLNRLVGNLLDLSRIEAGSIQPEKGWYDLGSLVNEVAGRLRRLAASHDLVLDVPEDLPPAAVRLRGDRPGADQPDRERRQVHAAGSRDHGLGPRERRRRASGSRRQRAGHPGGGVAAPVRAVLPGRPASTGRRASGLGLAVARGLVEAHGGRIWAENRAEGGARFVFTLPVERQRRPSRVRVTDDVTSGARILVVDDEPGIVRALRTNLDGHGFTVDDGGDWAKRSASLRRRTPDLIILDLGLPDMDGTEVIRELRRNEQHADHRPLRPRGASATRCAALDLGADDYLTKPFGVDELLARVRVALRHAAQPASGARRCFAIGDLEVDLEHRRVTWAAARCT